MTLCVLRALLGDRAPQLEVFNQTARRGLVALSNGPSLELDASNVAASNQVTFDPVTVPADGRLRLSLSVASGSTYGYLRGVLLEFIWQAQTSRFL